MERGNILALTAGGVAAFFYVSVFLHMGIGQLLWPLAAIPFYMVTLSREASDNLLALAGAGVLISLFSLAGVLPEGGALKSMASFGLLVALPAILAGRYYQALTLDGQPARGEPLFAFFILAALAAFFLSSLVFMLMGSPLHTVFIDVARPLAENMQQHLEAMDAPQASYTIQDLTQAIVLQMAAFVPIVFVLIQGVCFLVARRFMIKFSAAGLPAIQLSPLHFPMVISFLFFAALAIYVYIVNQLPQSPLGFYLGPVVMALALPLAAQGIAAAHEKLLKTVSQLPRYGVYMVLLIALAIAPLFLGMVFILLGMLNQLYVSKSKLK